MNLTAQQMHPEDRGESGWLASIQLRFARTAEKTLLRERHHRGPLKVQRPFYPEGEPCHVYLLHPPGGVAGGDELRIDVDLEPGAHALLTTPGATKFYRSAGLLACQRQTLRVDGGTLEWLPQENILFPGARLHLDTCIRLDADARYMGWEVHCLGRPVIGEDFDPGEANFRMALYRGDKPLLLDRWRVNGKRDLQGAASLRNHPVVGTWLASNADRTLLERARESVLRPTHGEIGLTMLEDLLVARYLGDSTEEARRLFHSLWQTMRPLLLGRDACPPRIWAT